MDYADITAQGIQPDSTNTQDNAETVDDPISVGALSETGGQDLSDDPIEDADEENEEYIEEGEEEKEDEEEGGIPEEKNVSSTNHLDYMLNGHRIRASAGLHLPEGELPVLDFVSSAHQLNRRQTKKRRTDPTSGLKQSYCKETPSSVEDQATEEEVEEFIPYTQDPSKAPPPADMLALLSQSSNTSQVSITKAVHRTQVSNSCLEFILH
jgi:hypothetical protein